MTLKSRLKKILQKEPEIQIFKTGENYTIICDEIMYVGASFDEAMYVLSSGEIPAEWKFDYSPIYETTGDIIENLGKEIKETKNGRIKKSIYH